MAEARGWALVTGACSGIGLEIATELARRGYPLLLFSNRCGELDAVAARLNAEHQVATQAVTMDLARPEAARELYEEVRRRGLVVDILVSNAGMFFFGEVAETDPVRANALLQLHVVTPALLAHYFAAEMRARRSGHLVFVSSASAWKDFPGLAFYGSSKRFLRSFAESLREELRPWGVNVTCVAPGAVATGLYQLDTPAARMAARLGLIKDPATVARASVRGTFKRKRLVLPGADARLMALGAVLTPRWLISILRTRTDYLPKPPD
jgi:uncharacterized protein